MNYVIWIYLTASNFSRQLDDVSALKAWFPYDRLNRPDRPSRLKKNVQTIGTIIWKPGFNLASVDSVSGLFASFKYQNSGSTSKQAVPNFQVDSPLQVHGDASIYFWYFLGLVGAWFEKSTMLSNSLRFYGKWTFLYWLISCVISFWLLPLFHRKRILWGTVCFESVRVSFLSS